MAKKNEQEVLNLTAEQVDRWRLSRWKARTDLLYLCNYVLNYPDVQKEVHGPLIDNLQKFPVPTWEQMKEHDKYIGGKWEYKPLTPLYQLDKDGFRRRLILDSRGFLKTTINCFAHTIQWLLNYPQATILIVGSSGSKIADFMSEIKLHFINNPILRQMFPEYGPKKQYGDWGTQSSFDIECKPKFPPRREPSVMGAAIEEAIAGYHFDIIKFTDIVEEKNVVTAGQIKKVTMSYGMFQNLLVRPESWIDVEGTRYSHADVYGSIIDGEEKRKKEDLKPVYKIYVRGCYKKKTPDGQPQKFIPDELYYPDAKDEQGKPISWWPERWTVEKLEEKRNDPSLGDYSAWLFACQQKNNPTDLSDENLIPFPFKKLQTYTISRENYRKNIRVNHHIVTVDTADTTNAKSKYSAITVGAWDQYGRCYITDIRHGRYQPNRIIQEIFDVQEKYNPLYILVEDYAFTRGLFPNVLREIQAGKINPVTNKPYPWVNFKFIKRDNDLSKQERILNTLQQPFNCGDLRFLEDLECYEALVKEFTTFPSGIYTDIMDTISDQWQGKTWFGREQTRQTFEEKQTKELEKFLQIQDPYKEDGYMIPQPSHNRTIY